MHKVADMRKACGRIRKCVHTSLVIHYVLPLHL